MNPKTAMTKLKNLDILDIRLVKISYFVRNPSVCRKILFVLIILIAPILIGLLLRLIWPENSPEDQVPTTTESSPK